MRYVVSLAAALAVSLCGLPAMSEDYGQCKELVAELTSLGGAIEKITASNQNRSTLEVTYTHRFGTVTASFEPSYNPDWEKMTSAERRTLIAGTLRQLDDEREAIAQGHMWYIVANREAVGLPPFPDLRDKTHRTKWRPYYAFAAKDRPCTANFLDFAVFEEDLPQGIREKLLMGP